MCKWLWVRVQLQSLNFRFCNSFGKEFLDAQAALECGFTLKRVRDMLSTYSLMNRTDKYSPSLAKWLNVRLQIKWLLVRIQFQSRAEDFCKSLFYSLDARPRSSKKLLFKGIINNP